MVASCKDERMQFVLCIQKSPCVLIYRNKPADCIKDNELKKDMPDLCRAYLHSFLECRRGMIDKTKRISGNAPLSTGKYDEEYKRMCDGDYNPRVELRSVQKGSSKN
ncbi:probable Mitochondrial protein PET191 [Hanseniaspora guilliermondii]|uniref:Probable Mitochondrial protein PET191 n=1 Tax=Hanseniaspora guilliermondii TaxID=56406 RepID=A0A1L0FH28_9ASCO|nr:probable Mitochondrial protein PET191 [Hanseniaspora guilliermondii]